MLDQALIFDCVDITVQAATIQQSYLEGMVRLLADRLATLEDLFQ